MKRKHLQSIIDELARAEEAHVAMVRLLDDRLKRIEAAQVEMLQSLSKTVDYLGYVREIVKNHELDELDRGQTASALHGLIKRIDKFGSKLKEPA